MVEFPLEFLALFVLEVLNEQDLWPVYTYR